MPVRSVYICKILFYKIKATQIQYKTFNIKQFN